LSRHFDSWTLAVPRTIQGVIFSDLGQASKFMALNWVQEALRECLGFAPYPATLNVRPSTPQDVRLWDEIQREIAALPLAAFESGFCSAGLYFVNIRRLAAGEATLRGAVLLPAVVDYPKDKIEIVSRVRVKDALAVKDGDCLALEFDD
jgi:CTP-dependent riboflavin kinase